MGKTRKAGKKKPGKLHVELSHANWERLQTYLARYNEDAGRVTPRIKVAHAVNRALLEFLGGKDAR